MTTVYICDAVRTPFGRYGGALAGVRTDDLAAVPIAALRDRNPGLDVSRIDDVIYGCANQAGEDNRNVGRMALLLAGIPKEVPGATVNRLCGSSLDAVDPGGARDRQRRNVARDRRRRREHVAGAVCDGQGRCRVCARLQARGHDARVAIRQPEDAAGVRHRRDGRDRRERRRTNGEIARADQDAFAYRSQQRAAAAMRRARLAEEIVPVSIEQRKGRSLSTPTNTRAPIRRSRRSRS